MGLSGRLRLRFKVSEHAVVKRINKIVFRHVQPLYQHAARYKRLAQVEYQNYNLGAQNNGCRRKTHVTDILPNPLEFITNIKQYRISLAARKPIRVK